MNVAAVYGAVVLIWSTTPLGIRFSVESLDFIQALSIRMWFSLILCAVLVKVLALPFKRTRRAVHGYLVGAIAITGAMLCVYYSAQTLPSGLIAVVWGLTPLVVSLYSRAWLPDVSINSRQILSMLIAVFGLYIIFAQGIHIGHDMFLSLAVLVLGVNLHGISSVMLQYQQVVKGEAPTHPIVQTTGALFVSAPIYGLLWWAVSGPLPETISHGTWWAIGYLSVFGSVVGFIGYFYLMNRMSASDVSLITLLTPVLALLLGSYLADEQLALSSLLGAGIILGALFLYHLPHVQKVLRKLALISVKKA